MDARPGDADAERAAAERGPAHAPAAPPHVSRRVPGIAPGSHLLRRGRGGGAGGTAANAPFPDGVRSSAARGRTADTPAADGRARLTFFLELFLANGQKARRGT